MSSSVPPDWYDRVRARTALVLKVWIAIAAVIIVLQYTRYALFSVEKTSMLWGVLVGLVASGFLFGYLRFPTRR